MCHYFIIAHDLSQRKSALMTKFTPEKLKPLIKKLKIRQGQLSLKMGYSRCYISKVLNGHLFPDEKFHRLLVLAIAKTSKKNYKELENKLKGSEWEAYLP